MRTEGKAMSDNSEKEYPLVSIIIRTCGRPRVLRRALESVKRQTYPNIETVLVEDGMNVSERFIKKYYPDRNIRYFSTGEHVGRCRAGNIGLEKANGKYLNFLDDDDILLEEHVALLVKELENSEHRVAYAIAEEHQFVRDPQNEHRMRIRRKCIKYKQPFNRLLLCYMNYFPIQSVLFEKKVYEENGGFDESLEIFEDWDMWLRFALHNDFLYVPEVTSVYYTPFKGKNKKKRDIGMRTVEEEAVDKHLQYMVQMNAKQIRDEMDYILNVFNKKRLLFYMQKIRNYLLYRDY